jgi:hydrogenase expression/formation protein HypE
MMGAKPKYLTCSFIIEEGFNLRDLEKIVRSMKKELEINGAIIVSGDTKVVPKGAVDKLFINISGVGEIRYKNISAYNIKEGHSILVSRDIGTHGATIFASREGITLESAIKSDCASLYPIVQKLIEANVKLIALRDATRGGVSAVLNEWAKASNVCIEINENAIPISQEVRGISEFLGFEPLSLANEGTFLIATTKEDEQKILDILKSFNQNAAIIGQVTNEHLQKVVLKSSWGTKRFLDMPTGELLPRIC